MSAIMIDNWTIENSITYLATSERRRTYESSWIQFLTALVLWDEIWFYDNSTSYFWKRLLEYTTVFDCFNDILYPIEVDSSVIAELTGVTEPSYQNYITRKQYNDRSSLYQLLSNVLGISNLLHESRSSEDSLFSRRDLFDKIDQTIQTYYDEINSKLGKKLLTMKYPIIYDYIVDLSSSKTDQLKRAIELRNQKELVLFRENIESIEYLINSGDTQLLLSQLELLDNIAKKFMSSYSSNISLGEFQIGLAPSLSLSKPITIRNPLKRKPKIHTSFIKRLIKQKVCGSSERIMK